MIDLKDYEIWFVTGRQHLYGDEALREVAANAAQIASGLESSERIPLKVVYKPIVTTPDAITALCLEANNHLVSVSNGTTRVPGTSTMQIRTG